MRLQAGWRIFLNRVSQVRFLPRAPGHGIDRLSVRGSRFLAAFGRAAARRARRSVAPRMISSWRCRQYGAYVDGGRLTNWSRAALARAASSASAVASASRGLTGAGPLPRTAAATAG